jgi:predicted Holliday junction resolvase-like endonuclease
MITLPMPVLVIPALLITALLAVLYLQYLLIRNLNQICTNSDKLIVNYKELITNLQETIKIRDDLLKLKDDLITNQKEIIRVDKVVNNCNNRLIAIAKERAEKFEYLYNLAKNTDEEERQRYDNEYKSFWTDPETYENPPRQ